jgi:hypothetical protein
LAQDGCRIWIARPSHGESYAKLLDFGIAKLVDPTRTNLTQTGAVPLCMSSDQCGLLDENPLRR